MVAVSFDGVHKSYGDVHALRGVSFDVQPGELVALLGPNGAGKTTAFELLLGLGRPTSGQVRVHGMAPGGRAVVTRVGAMLQNAGLQETATVYEAVALVGRAYPNARTVADVLDRVGMAKRAERMVTDLSGGERQRLLLAMAIVGRPDLLVLDEPTVAMDVAARREFWDETRRSADDGVTIVFATHNLAEADEAANRVIVLQNGELIADATPEQLKHKVHGKVAEFDSNVPPDHVESLVAPARVELVASTDLGWRFRVHSDQPADIIAALVAHGGAVDDLTIRDADLEDAFIELTGDRS